MSKPIDLPTRKDLRRMLNALALQLPEEVWTDVNAEVTAYADSKEAEIVELRGQVLEHELRLNQVQLEAAHEAIRDCRFIGVDSSDEENKVKGLETAIARIRQELGTLANSREKADEHNTTNE